MKSKDLQTLLNACIQVVLLEIVDGDPEKKIGELFIVKNPHFFSEENIHVKGPFFQVFEVFEKLLRSQLGLCNIHVWLQTLHQNHQERIFDIEAEELGSCLFGLSHNQVQHCKALSLLGL